MISPLIFHPFSLSYCCEVSLLAEDMVVDELLVLDSEEESFHGGVSCAFH